MKNLEFKNNKIEKYCQYIIEDHKVVNYIIDNLLTIYQNITIEEIVGCVEGIRITLSNNDLIYYIDIDYSNKSIKVSSKELPYKIVYDDNQHEYYHPIGYEYQIGKRKIFQKFLMRHDNQENQEYFLVIKNNHNKFRVLIKMKKDNNFDITTIIHQILSYSQDINDINILAELLKKIINLKEVYVRITNDNHQIMELHDGIAEECVQIKKKLLERIN